MYPDLVYSTAREGQDGCLGDISSNSCVKMWVMDLVRSLFQVQEKFCLSKFKDRSRSESSLLLRTMAFRDRPDSETSQMFIYRMQIIILEFKTSCTANYQYVNSN